MYRAIIHYHFKKGMEEKGIRFFENVMMKKAQELGCHDLELWISEKDPSILVGMGSWNSLEEARAFQSFFQAQEKEFLQMCTSMPKREFYKIHKSFEEKKRKSA